MAEKSSPGVGGSRYPDAVSRIKNVLFFMFIRNFDSLANVDDFQFFIAAIFFSLKNYYFLLKFNLHV